MDRRKKFFRSSPGLSEEKTDRLAELAADLVRLKVDVIVCAFNSGTLAAKRATTTIPIVMVNSADPVGAGLVASLAQPGGNVTGMSGLTVELNTKRLEVLKDAVPQARRLGFRESLQAPPLFQTIQMKEVRVAYVALKLKLEEIKSLIGLESSKVLQKPRAESRSAILVVVALYWRKENDSSGLAAKYLLPAIYSEGLYEMRAVLCTMGRTSMTYSAGPPTTWTRLLKGAKPADLPVQL